MSRGAGLLARLGLVGLGLALDTLAIPPGPLPAAVLVADVPFLLLIGLEGGRAWKRWALLYGSLHFGVALHWLSHVMPAHPVVTGLILGLVYLPFGAALRWGRRRRVPWFLLVPTAAVLEEMLRTVWFGGMPWPTRSLSLAASGAFVASCATAGAYALSFLAALSSAAVLEAGGALIRPRGGLRRAGARAALAVLLPLLAAGALFARGTSREAEYGARVSEGTVASYGPVVAIQGDVPQALKSDAMGGGEDRGGGTSTDAANRIFQRHVSLTRRALEAEAAAGHETALVVWPETMIPWLFVDPAVARVHPGEWENQVRILQHVAGTVPAGMDVKFLLGALAVLSRDGTVTENLAGNPTRDSLFFVRGRDLPRGGDPYPPLPGPEGPPWQLGRHDKVALVPGGEYTPLGDQLPPLRWLRDAFSVGIPELDPGEPDQPPFRLGEALRAGQDPLPVEAGTVICFELVFPARCRSWRNRGAAVLLNASNYGWFGHSAEDQAPFRAQIQALASLRAAETGTSVVMAGNRGPTLFFDPLGRRHGRFLDGLTGLVLEPLGGGETTYRQGWAVGTVAVEPVLTPYVRWGDLPWYLLGALCLLLGLLPRSGGRPPEMV